MCDQLKLAKAKLANKPDMAALKLMAFVRRKNIREVSNRQTDRQTDPTTVTLAAHARRGLITQNSHSGA